MRLPALLTAALLLAATPAFAQAPSKGASVAETRAWLISLGGSVAEPQSDSGAQTLTVADQLPWSVTFYNCAAGATCDDVQFAAVFTGPITAEQVNAWNREHRYLKAFFVPAVAGGEAGAVAQYDVVLTATGTDQLQEPTALWLGMLRQFAEALAQGAAATAPPAQ